MEQYDPVGVLEALIVIFVVIISIRSNIVVYHVGEPTGGVPKSGPLTWAD